LATSSRVSSLVCCEAMVKERNKPSLLFQMF
jgi:hypothetical protein